MLPSRKGSYAREFHPLHLPPRSRSNRTAFASRLTCFHYILHIVKIKRVSLVFFELFFDVSSYLSRTYGKFTAGRHIGKTRYIHMQPSCIYRVYSVGVSMFSNTIPAGPYQSFRETSTSFSLLLNRLEFSI